MTLKDFTSEKIVLKGENHGDQHSCFPLSSKSFIGHKTD